MKLVSIKQIKHLLEVRFPECFLAWDNETGKPHITSRKNYKIIAYTYYKKWVITGNINQLDKQLPEFIELLSRWDGKSY